jgi:hypothetical protein
MRNALFVCLFFLGYIAQAQVSLGLKGGVSFPANKAETIVMAPDGNALEVAVDKTPMGLHFGGYVRAGGRFFVQPEVLFNSSRVDYRIREANAQEVILTERYNNLDIPVMAGLSAGPFRLTLGPVAHYHLNSRSELTDIDGYEARFKQLTWGWQGGIGLGMGKVSIDARYEGNFSKQANHLTFFGEEYSFSNTPSRFLVSLNYGLF